MLSTRISWAATRSGAPSRIRMSAYAGTGAFDAQHKLLPMADAANGVSGAQCAWDPPV